MMDDINNIFNDLKRDIPLAEASTVGWSEKYFENEKERYKRDLSFVQQYYQGGDVLEIGSAPFHFTYILKRNGINVKGIDIAPERFTKFIQKHQLDVVACDIEKEKLPFKENRFDLIIFFEVFEHLRINPIATLLEITRVLKKGGVLLLQTPNLYKARRIRRMFLGKGFDNPYKEFSKLEKLGHMGHTRIYTASQVQLFLEKTGTMPQKTFYTSKKNKRLNKFYISNFLAKLFPILRSHFLIVAQKN